MSKFHKGKILLSTPDVAGDVFSRSVVLLVDHNEDGAFGLILNKKNKTLSESLSGLFGFDLEVYDGGPVENDKIFFIVRGVPINDYHLALDEEHYITDDSETLLALVMEGKLDVRDVKIFSGYSGWARHQLEKEISNKYWNVLEIDHLQYTKAGVDGLWKKIMQNLGGEFLLWANAPADISMN